MYARTQLACAVVSTCVMLLVPAAASAQHHTYWQHDPATSGNWMAPGNWDGGLPSLDDWCRAHVDNGGEVLLDHGIAETVYLYVGGGLESRVVQESGSLFQVDKILIGDGPGLSGVYEFRGGHIENGLMPGSHLPLRIGYEGNGVFRQSGGTCHLNSILGVGSTTGHSGGSGLFEMTGGEMYATGPGHYVGSGGTFLQSGGSFATTDWTDEFGIGLGGRWNVSGAADFYAHSFQAKNPSMGDIHQSGGTVRIDYLTVGTDYTWGIEEGDGSYLMTGGALHTQRCGIGHAHSDGAFEGVFRQEAGMHTSTTVYVGLGSGTIDPAGWGGNGVYEMVGGTLATEALYVGTRESGTFTQTGGSVTTDVLDIGAGDLYEYAGGTLAVNTLLNIAGTLDFQGHAGTLTVGDASWANLSQATAANAESASVTFGANTLTIISPGQDPHAMFGSFTTGGIVHEQGTTLEIPAGTTLVLRQDFDDHVRCAGSLVASTDKEYAHSKLRRGVAVPAGGSVGIHDVEIRNAVSGISGGTLSCDHLHVLPGGLFTQSGGTTTVEQDTRVEGTYALEGGTMVLGFGSWLDVVGQFTQTGGTNTLSYTDIDGTYLLEDGVIQATKQEVDVGGLLRQTGGTNTTNEMTVFQRYELAGGQLTVTDEATIYEDFQQTGGTFTADNTLYICGHGSNVQLESGQLTAAATTVGSALSEALMRQTGGTHTAGALSIGEEAAYELLGGTLTVGEEMILMGTLDFADGDGALAILEGGVGSFAGGSMLGGQNATITAETGTELFFPAGFNPFADLAYYECLGTTHLYGDTWDIAAGETERASGEVHSHVRCAGRLLPATGADGYTLREGVEVLPGGEVDTGTGALVVVDDVSGIAGSELRTASIVVGTPEAAGTFAQSGGTVTVSDPDVTGGVQVGSRWVFGSTTDPGAVGEYRISDGMLTAPNIAVGFDAQGRFVQTGGTVNVHDCVRIAEASFGGADGVYEMSGGQLNAGNVSVGDNGRFTHSGGHIEADFLLCNGSGSYEMSGTATLHAKTLRGGAALLGPDNAVVLSDSFHASKHCTLAAGSMTTPQVTVSDKGGLLQQSGGMLTTDIFEVQGYGDPSEYATYALAGGVCDVGARFQMDGTWDLADATAAVSWDTIIADISHGDIVNAGSASWTLGPRSLLIVRSGQNPATAFGSFHSTGMIHTRGTDLTIPAGRTIVGAGRIEDRVVCQGELRAENGASLQLVAGVSLDAGTVDLGAEGEAFIETDDCRITGGELRGGTAKILGDFSSNGARVNFDHSGGSMKSNVLAAKAIYNLSGTGRIDNNVTDLRRTDLHQTGGTLETGELHIGGRMSGSNPAIGYHMTHGQIDAETIRVSSVILQTNHGLSGGFAQTGGRVDVNNLYVGGGYGWCGLDEKPGRYELGGDGVLNTANTWVGKYSEGTFVQTGGTHQTQRLSGHTGSCESTYELRAGTLTAASAFFSGNDLFLQTGGLCNVSGRFAVVGQPGSYIQPDRGVVRIEGGLMTAGRMQVGIDGHVAGGLQLLHSEIRVGDLRVGDCQPDAYHPQLASQLRLMSADASMEVANVFKLGRCAAFTTSTWGAAIHMTGSAFENESTDPAAVEGLSKLTLVFEGGGSEVDPFEIASLDMGAGDPDAFEENFALGCLMLGGDAGIGQVLLVDDFDNQQDGADNEVLYVKELVLLEGSSLDLNGHTLYYQTLADAGCSIDLGSGGALTQAVPEPTVLSLVMLGAVGLLRRKRRRGMD